MKEGRKEGRGGEGRGWEGREERKKGPTHRNRIEKLLPRTWGWKKWGRVINE